MSSIFTLENDKLVSNNESFFPQTVTFQSATLSSFSWVKLAWTLTSRSCPALPRGRGTAEAVFWGWVSGLGRFGHTPFPCTADTRPSVAAVMTPCFWRPTQRHHVNNNPGLCSRWTNSCCRFFTQQGLGFYVGHFYMRRRCIWKGREMIGVQTGGGKMCLQAFRLYFYILRKWQDCEWKQIWLAS